jgi:hypothetical protein
VAEGEPESEGEPVADAAGDELGVKEGGAVELGVPAVAVGEARGERLPRGDSDEDAERVPAEEGGGESEPVGEARGLAEAVPEPAVPERERRGDAEGVRLPPRAHDPVAAAEGVPPPPLTEGAAELLREGRGEEEGEPDCKGEPEPEGERCGDPEAEGEGRLDAERVPPSGVPLPSGEPVGSAERETESVAVAETEARGELEAAGEAVWAALPLASEEAVAGADAEERGEDEGGGLAVGPAERDPPAEG